MGKLRCLTVVFLAGVAGCVARDADGTDDESTATVEPAQQPQPYEVVALHSSKCLDVQNASVARDAPIVQASCEGGRNQKWLLRSDGGGYSEIVSLHSRKCLAVAHASLVHGSTVVQGDCQGEDNQKWRLVPVGTVWAHAVYEIVAKHSGKCLAVAHASLVHGSTVVQGDCWGRDDQRFILRPTGD
jgi:hypothetical protein